MAREAPFSICDSRRGRCRLGGQVSWKLANISSLYLRLPGPPPSRKEISSKAVFPDGPFPPVGGNTGQGAGKALEASDADDKELFIPFKAVSRTQSRFARVRKGGNSVAVL